MTENKEPSSDNSKVDIGEISDIYGSQLNIAGGDIHIHQLIPPKEPPIQLPPRPLHFQGRDLELSQLLTDLQLGHLVTLCGPGGIGKTALADDGSIKAVRVVGDSFCILE